MTRLIDADALHREFIDFIRASNNKTPNWNDAVSLVGSAPTVDAVPVVRCGECAYRRRCMLQHFVESNAVDGAKIDWSEWYCADGVLDISKSDGESEDDAD